MVKTQHSKAQRSMVKVRNNDRSVAKQDINLVNYRQNPYTNDVYRIDSYKYTEIHIACITVKRYHSWSCRLSPAGTMTRLSFVVMLGGGGPFFSSM